MKKIKRNREAILRLAQFIENGRYAFDMNAAVAIPACGTAGCIGGHAAQLWRGIRQHPMHITFAVPHDHFTWNEAMLAEKLGLDLATAHDLCFPYREHVKGFDPNEYVLDQIDRSMAVAALRRLAARGLVKFDIKDRAKAAKAKAGAR